MIKVIDGKIYVVRGDDDALNISLPDYTLGEGDVLKLTVRELPDEDSPVLLQIAGAPGAYRIPISRADTEELPFGAYSAFIRVYTANGLRHTIFPDDITDQKRQRVTNMKNFIVASEVPE